MRKFWALLLLTVLAACNRPKEFRGLYMSQDGNGVFFPCADSTLFIHVQDSGLSTRYDKLAGASPQPIFVRVRGVQRDSGSVYGGPHYLDVREVIEMRARAPGECPGVAGAGPSL